jgi:hypothetical protein
MNGRVGEFPVPGVPDRSPGNVVIKPHCPRTWGDSFAVTVPMMSMTSGNEGNAARKVGLVPDAGAAAERRGGRSAAERRNEGRCGAKNIVIRQCRAAGATPLAPILKGGKLTYHSVDHNDMAR